MDGRRWFSWALAGLSVCAAVGAWPEILGRIVTADGSIASGRVVFFLRCVTAAGVLVAGTCVVLGRKGRTPSQFATALWRRSAVLIGGALCLGAVGYGAFHLHARLVSRVDLVASVSPNHALATKIQALPTQQERLDALVAYFQARPANSHVEPSAYWLTDPELARRNVELREQGRLGEPSGSDLMWRPGMRLDWSSLRNTPLEFSLQRRDFIAELLTDTRLAPSGAQLDWAAALVEEWHAGNAYWPDWDPFVWNDDTTSNRIQMDMLLMELRREAKRTTRAEELAFLTSLIQHADRLSDESRLNQETNHGLMQIDALLDIAARYPEFDQGGRWWALAKARLRAYFERSVTPDGVALELSPGYHSFITVKLVWAFALLLEQRDPLAAELEPVVRAMLAFLAELMLPDGHLPTIGDTGDARIDMHGLPWDLLPDLPVARFLGAGGSLALPANQPGVIFSHAGGYFILRAPNPEWSTSQGLMAILMLGPLSRAHFHPDKLSLTLFAKGRSIFAGPGYISFFDDTREASIGTDRQGTVSVDGRSQTMGPADTGFILHKATDATPGQVAIQGLSRLYAGVLHRRTLLYGVQDGKLLLIDELHSDEAHTYSQGFPLGRGLDAQLARGEAELGLASPETQGTRLCRVSTRVGDAGSAPLPSVDHSILRFQTVARSTFFVTEIDCSPDPSDYPNWRLFPTRIDWLGPHGAWSVNLPVNGEGQLRWTPPGD